MGCGGAGLLTTVIGAGAGFALGGPGGALKGAMLGGSVGSAVEGAQAQSEANRVAKYQGQLTAEQYEVAKEDYEFQKDLYETWQDLYGDVEQNLADFFSSYDNEDIKKLGLENIHRHYMEATAQKELQMQQVEQRATANFAQRGLETSGLKQETMEDIQTQRTNYIEDQRLNENLAGLQYLEQQRYAPQEAQMNFLSLGLGQSGAMQRNVSLAAQSAANNIGASANYLGNVANRYRQIGAANMQVAGNLAIRGFSPPFPQPDNLQLANEAANWNNKYGGNGYFMP